MVIAVDVGNTGILIGGYDGEKQLFLSRISTRAHATADEYAVKLLHILALYRHTPDEIEGAIISSVVPPLSSCLEQALKLLKNVRVYTVGPGLKTGLNIKIDNPSQLGSDMVAEAVAVLDGYSIPAVIIDVDTAITFTAIDAKKQLIGCAIVPGITISLDALTQNTALLQKIDLSEPVRSVVGRNTIDSMRAGSLIGNACMIDGMIARYREELGENLTVVVTGAQAKQVLPYCRETFLCNENLLLDGLRLIYEKNQK